MPELRSSFKHFLALVCLEDAEQPEGPSGSGVWKGATPIGGTPNKALHHPRHPCNE